MECEIDEEFRKEIKLALGDAALPSSESEDDNVDDLDDEAMMRVDDALAAAFRARKKSSTTKKNRKGCVVFVPILWSHVMLLLSLFIDFQQQLMDFRLRVLDLIEIYIRWQSKSLHSLDLVLPLFRLIMSCSNDTLPLANRATNIFTKKLCHMKEYPRITEADQAHVFDLLQQLLQAAYKVPTAGQELITQGSMFLLRVLRGGKRELNEPVVSKKKRKRSNLPDVNFGLIDVTTVIPLFSDLLTDFLTNKNSHVHHMLFMTLVERYPDLAWHLCKDLASYLPNAVNQFRMGQACEIMASLLHQPVQLTEAKSECLLSICKDLKCFCIEHLKCDGQKKSKHIKPLVKLLSQLIISCKEQPDVFAGCFDQEELLTEINELIEESSNHNSILIANECRKLITLLNKVDDNMGLGHKTKKRRKK
ncbi:myb-binding protein 1A-like protein [Dysidea avara]|uniref:myb-binding protein 1A-like protein n=1 Tax=Dysidea avara TaxID=196820 RepID=UPI0033294FDD